MTDASGQDEQVRREVAALARWAVARAAADRTGRTDPVDYLAALLADLYQTVGVVGVDWQAIAAGFLDE